MNDSDALGRAHVKAIHGSEPNPTCAFCRAHWYRTPESALLGEIEARAAKKESMDPTAVLL